MKLESESFQLNLCSIFLYNAVIFERKPSQDLKLSLLNLIRSDRRKTKKSQSSMEEKL
ncbi:predicted protein [Arabidopsis lyrata subsp. lyrata]|uniref:Predicted protein n=1 Tax=Arabidopsis lyrata subsp. lyrata TaxID=81972 RepID=D7M7Q6_ARALL|nr:predicted protein [Arabidopsis lyrata subsp. lyrata]